MPVLVPVASPIVPKAGTGVDSRQLHSRTRMRLCMPGSHLPLWLLSMWLAHEDGVGCDERVWIPNSGESVGGWARGDGEKLWRVSE